MKWFKNIIGRLKPVKWKNIPEHEIEFVFMSGGKKHFKFVNPQKGPYLRMIKAQDIYTESALGISNDYLDSFFAAIEEATKKGDLNEVFKLTFFAKQRRENLTETMLMFKRASVIFFDEDENCYDYDYEYNEKKINRWVKDKDLVGFFLKEPIQTLLPYLDGSGITFHQYLKVEADQLLTHLRFHLQILSKSSSDKDMIATLSSQIKTLENYLASNVELF